MMEWITFVQHTGWHSWNEQQKILCGREKKERETKAKPGPICRVCGRKVYTSARCYHLWLCIWYYESTSRYLLLLEKFPFSPDTFAWMKLFASQSSNGMFTSFSCFLNILRFCFWTAWLVTVHSFLRNWYHLFLPKWQFTIICCNHSSFILITVNEI